MIFTNRFSFYKLLIISIISNVLFINAQQNDSVDSIDLNSGKNLLLYGKYNEALLTFKQIIDSLDDNDKQIAKSYNLLSSTHYKLQQIEKAFTNAKTALEFSLKAPTKNILEQANALDNIGATYYYKGAFKEAQEHYEKALKIRLDSFKNDHLNLAASYLRLGKVRFRQGNYPSALESLNIALDFNIQDSVEGTILKANIHEAFGQINYDQGAFDKALESFQKQYELAKSVYQETHPYISEVFNQLALIFTRKKEYYKSIEYIQKALSVSAAKYGLDKHPGQIKFHFNLGTAYLDSGNVTESLFHTKKALQMGIEMMGEDFPMLHFPYSQLGRIYGGEEGIYYINKAIEILEKQKNQRASIIISYLYSYQSDLYKNLEKYSEALDYCKMALDIRLKAFGKNNINTIETQNEIAKLLLALKDFDNALLHNNEAIQNNYLINYFQNTSLDYPQLISSIDNGLLLQAKKTKGDILLAIFKKSGDINYLLESNSYYKKAESIINSLRNRKRNYQDKIKFSSTIKTLYAKIIETEQLINSKSKNQINIDSTFYYIEKSKANVIRELVKNTNVKKLSGINENILDLEKNIDNKIAMLTSNIVKEISNKNIDTTKVYKLEGQLFDFTNRKDSLEKRIENNYPKYYDLKYEKKIIAISELQNKLSEDETFLEYLISNNTIYASVITKNSSKLVALANDNLQENINRLNRNIINKKTSNYLQISQLLYKQLIDPIQTYFVGNKLIISPDDSLWHLPFDLLVTSNEKHKNKPKYLLYDYAIGYANSASMLYENTLNTKSSSLLNECIAFAYTKNDSIDDSTHADLPGSREEVETLSEIFEGNYFYDLQANETNFKTNVDRYKLVHLALHAEIDSLNPEHLKIKFPNPQTNDQEDNTLYSHEVYSINIPADLVVLSACNTGTGKVNQGEGILSIGNAFQYAGAKSLLLSRWAISDQTTPIVMKHFYTNLKKGMTKTEALQKAKIDYIDSASLLNASPYYWGSFYILGNTDPVKLDPNFKLIYYGFGILLFLVLVFFLLRKKKN